MFERLLAALTLLAITMLLAALGFSTAGVGLGALEWPSFGWLSGLVPAGETVAAPAGRLLENGGLLTGFALGWGLRWVYALPWAAMPRAFVAWLLGWRSSAMMVSLAVGCMAVLLLY